MLSIFTRNSTNRKQLLNLSPNLCTNKPKHDIMHSAKLKTMCSADKDFAMRIYQKGLCGKAFGLRLFTPKLWLKPLKRRDDGSHRRR